MQRYDPIQTFQMGGHAYGEMKECADGDYVKFDDVEAARCSAATDENELKEACRVIGLYLRWEQASDREIEADIDLDTGTMLIEASFAATEFVAKRESARPASVGLVGG